MKKKSNEPEGGQVETDKWPLALARPWGLATVLSVRRRRVSFDGNRQIAKNENESDEDVVAALLHDVGHLLLHESRDNPDFLEKNLNHEDVAAEWLKLFFPSRVVGPVHGHVMAKRYLCAVDETYWNGLSEASKQSLRLQGGAMSELECSQFEKKPYFKSAIKLRKIDDRAKGAGAKTSPLSAYYEHVIQLYCADG